MAEEGLHLDRIRSLIDQITHKDQGVFSLFELSLVKELQELVPASMDVPDKENSTFAKLICCEGLMNNRWQ